jgi:hypothetical protein
VIPSITIENNLPPLQSSLSLHPLTSLAAIFIKSGDHSVIGKVTVAGVYAYLSEAFGQLNVSAV